MRQHVKNTLYYKAHALCLFGKSKFLPHFAVLPDLTQWSNVRKIAVEEKANAFFGILPFFEAKPKFYGETIFLKKSCKSSTSKYDISGKVGQISMYFANFQQLYSLYKYKKS